MLRLGAKGPLPVKQVPYYILTCAFNYAFVLCLNFYHASSFFKIVSFQKIVPILRTAISVVNHNTRDNLFIDRMIDPHYRCSYIHRWELKCRPCNNRKESEVCPNLRNCQDCKDDGSGCTSCPPGRFGRWCTERECCSDTSAPYLQEFE